MTVSQRNINGTNAHRPASSVNNDLLPQTGNTGNQHGLISGITLGLSAIAAMFAAGKKRRRDDDE